MTLSVVTVAVVIAGVSAAVVVASVVISAVVVTSVVIAAFGIVAAFVVAVASVITVAVGVVVAFAVVVDVLLGVVFHSAFVVSAFCIGRRFEYEQNYEQSGNGYADYEDNAQSFGRRACGEVAVAVYDGGSDVEFGSARFGHGVIGHREGIETVKRCSAEKYAGVAFLRGEIHVGICVETEETQRIIGRRGVNDRIAACGYGFAVLYRYVHGRGFHSVGVRGQGVYDVFRNEVFIYGKSAVFRTVIEVVIICQNGVFLDFVVVAFDEEESRFAFADVHHGDFGVAGSFVCDKAFVGRRDADVHETVVVCVCNVGGGEPCRRQREYRRYDE